VNPHSRPPRSRNVVSQRPNGDYLTLRAKPTPSHQWHDLKVRIAGTKVEGYVDGTLYFEHVLPERVSGRIGLWSKADTTFRRLHPDASRLSNAAGGALRSLKAAKDYALVVSPAALARDEMHARFRFSYARSR
jgi:hypothetical protein